MSASSGGANNSRVALATTVHPRSAAQLEYAGDLRNLPSSESRRRIPARTRIALALHVDRRVRLACAMSSNCSRHLQYREERYHQARKVDVRLEERGELDKASRAISTAGSSGCGPTTARADQMMTVRARSRTRPRPCRLQVVGAHLRQLGARAVEPDAYQGKPALRQRQLSSSLAAALMRSYRAACAPARRAGPRPSPGADGARAAAGAT